MTLACLCFPYTSNAYSTTPSLFLLLTHPNRGSLGRGGGGVSSCRGGEYNHQHLEGGWRMRTTDGLLIYPPPQTPLSHPLLSCCLSLSLYLPHRCPFPSRLVSQGRIEGRERSGAERMLKTFPEASERRVTDWSGRRTAELLVSRLRPKPTEGSRNKQSKGPHDHAALQTRCVSS